MKISNTMNLSALAERMGSEVKDSEAAAMRDLLVDTFDGEDTADVPSDEWSRMLDAAAGK